MGTKFKSFCFSTEIYANLSTSDSMCSYPPSSDYQESGTLEREQISTHIGESFQVCMTCDIPKYPNEEVIYHDASNLYLGVCREGPVG